MTKEEEARKELIENLKIPPSIISQSNCEIKEEEVKEFIKYLNDLVEKKR